MQTLLKNILLTILLTVFVVSCVSKKVYDEALQARSRTADELATTQSQLQSCNTDKQLLEGNIKNLEELNENLRQQISMLNNTNAALMNNVDNLATLSKEEAKNLERSLESLREKDREIKTMRDAITKRDSVTLALVTSIKGVLGNLQDDDIEVNVEKGVVYIAISDKLLFSSGSYTVNESAKVVLGKVAKVVKDKPEIEFMVEGHTDNVPIKQEGIADNWDLSVLRAASIVRVLQEEYEVEPERMTAAGRSFYVPKAENDSAEGRSKNRRTRIVILPKLDQFFAMVEDGMEKAIAADSVKTGE